ncbi:hypothetical protein [Halorarius halobius]|uniref:hypothetical protein n=1 Tax=Halorarius halobius TaxID=2962671 RepID=UPI0020CC9046|nr:hypothetical protein [Halorarius halobius]
MADERGFGRRAVVALLAAFAVPPVVLVWVAAADVAVPPAVTMAAVLVPLGALTLGLGLLARRVASSPDEPELVDSKVAENVGMTSEEYEELLDR